MASSLGKMPAASVRRLISPLSRSIGLISGMRLGAWLVRPDGFRAYGATIRDDGHRPATTTSSQLIEWMGLPFVAFPKGVRRIIYTTDEIDE